MKNLWRIGGYNLVLVLGAAGILRLVIRQEYALGISGYGSLMALLILGLFFLNLLGALITGDSGRRWAFLLSALLVLLVGFGVCAVGVNSIPRTQELPIVQ